MKPAAFWRRAVILCSISLGLGLNSGALGQTSSSASCEQLLEAKGFEKHDGLFHAYGQPGGAFYVAISKEDLDKDYIFANYVDRGVAPIVGLYAEPKLVKFRRSGDFIDILEMSSVTYFDESEPLRRAEPLTMSASILASLKVQKCSTADIAYVEIGTAALKGLSSEFVAMVEQQVNRLDLGWDKASLAGWDVFSDNLSFITDLKAKIGPQQRGGDSDTEFAVRIRHLLLKRSEADFAPRLADPRIGYFTVTRRNVGAIDQADVASYIHRWRLEKKDPGAALSEPVKPIVYWIENTTPTKLRPYIRRGALAWNEAFRQAGFLNAIEVHEQPDDAPWEAGDISKNVIRWQASSGMDGSIGFGPAIHDPVSGEILGADILMTFEGIGNFIDDWDRLSPEAAPVAQGAASARIVSADDNSAGWVHGENISNGHFGALSSAAGLTRLYNIAKLFETSRAVRSSGGATIEKIRSHNARNEGSSDLVVVNEPNEGGVPSLQGLGLADRMIEEVVVSIVMHEVGHTLGLTHNFRGSYWRSIDEIFDREKTNGIVTASIMDYAPLNLSPMDKEQGDFANTRVGPYDSWAIEFGYRPRLDDAVAEEAARSALLDKAGKPGFLFGGGGNVIHDPQTLREDLTRNPVEYAEARVSLVLAMAERAGRSNDLQSMLEFHSLYNELFGQIFAAANVITSQVRPYAFGPFYSNGAGPLEVPAFRINDKRDQKSAIAALGRLIFAPGAIDVSEEFLFRLGASGFIVDRVSETRMNVKNTVLRQLIDRDLLLRMHHSNAFGGDYDATEMLLDLKNEVFGRDLSLLGRPRKDRRDQQILFVRALVDVIEDTEGAERNAKMPLYKSEQSLISASARPVLNALRRDLFLENPWLPREISAHRQELREIMASVR